MRRIRNTRANRKNAKPDSLCPSASASRNAAASRNTGSVVMRSMKPLVETTYRHMGTETRMRMK